MGRLTHPGKTLEFVESKALVYEDWSRDHGYPAAPRYDGKLIKVLCSLVYVVLPGRSRSICVQDAVIRREIRASAKISAKKASATGRRRARTFQPNTVDDSDSSQALRGGWS